MNWVSPADRTGDLTAPAASPQLRLPPLAPSTSLSFCAIWGSHTFSGFLFHTFSAIPVHFAYIIYTKFLPLACRISFTHTNRPQETAGDVGLLALSCCLQVKFTKLKWPVCFSLIGGAPLGARGCLLGSCSDDRALQEELCFRRRAEKMTPLIRLPLPLCDRNDSIMMYHIACIYSGVDAGQKEFIHKTEVSRACYFLPLYLLVIGVCLMSLLNHMIQHLLYIMWHMLTTLWDL